jgi:hypothetical protein
MTYEEIQKAEQEARRFLEKVEDFYRRYPTERGYIGVGTRETGAVRRASLDLTRQLAKMRYS